ncbi:hypothetical protein [Staphylococcus phage phiIPLA-RODI]|uniref:Uncharacterized protein n=1 Tax=Staphylococcus phage phiIPLA-RODI TaxID=1572703 RepID=A0A0D3MWA3_9CAUD|nr:hypothetical protein AVU41_gp190 [Staphylococcus phage phiIPLA-RODI]AJA42152.1 hypothetical protein [Staphylococcus phage phiIPLA-RODI]
MEHQIYIILYTEYNNEVEDEASVNEKYFTNKDDAIHQLEKEGFKHVCDDEYSLAWYLQAEIVLLEKEEL